MLAATGSTITAAIFSGAARNKPSTVSIELYRATIVIAASAAGTPRAVGLTKSHPARTGAHQHRVAMTVIASVKLDYVLATGGGAREPDRGESCFGSRSNQPDFLCAFDRRRDQFRELNFESRRRAETQAQPRLLCDRLHDARMSMSENRGTVGANVVEKIVAVGVSDCCTAATLDENWRSADGLPRAHGRIHRTRNR